MTNAKQQFTDKEFGNILTRIWLNASNNEVREIVKDTEEQFLNEYIKYDRKTQKNVLSYLCLKESGTNRIMIQNAIDTLEDWEG